LRFNLPQPGVSIIRAARQWFIFIDEVPGLGVVGPNYEDLLDRLKVMAGNMFRARGETVTDIKIIPSEKPALQVFH
jgi:predicted RNase H-like HicB family nuclease